MSYILEPKKQTVLTPYDLYDRIINLKLCCGKDKIKDEYVIRSDYEVCSQGGLVTSIIKGKDYTGSYIRRCQHKPSIKIEYKQVASDTDIEIDISINNFYLLDSSGTTLLDFNNAENPLQKVEVMMGYFGQFKNMLHSTPQQLMNFTPGFGVGKLEVNVMYVATDKIAPDAVLRIHGAVGSSNSTPSVGNSIAGTYLAVKDITVASNKGYIESMLFEHITKRFVRTKVQDVKSPIIAINGKMTAVQAKKEGIQVYCTKGVKAIKADKLVDSTGKEVDNEFAFLDGDTAKKAFNSICNYIGIPLRKVNLISGNWLVFTPEESYDVIQIGKEMDAIYLTEIEVDSTSVLQKHLLPAVYNITTSKGICTITCPFYFWVEPFNSVQFIANYSTAGLVTYFTGKVNKFRVINATVTFATVDDINSVTYTCAGEN